MPALLAPLLGFALGVALAWVRAGEPDRDERGLSSHGAVIAALFGAFVFGPVNGYFLAAAGDWSYAYFIDSRMVPSALEALLALADAASVPAGFLVARARVRAGAIGSLVALGAAPVGVALVVGVIVARRLRVDATFHQYRLDFGAQPVAGGRIGYALMWMGVVVVTGFVIAARAERSSRTVGGARAPASPPIPLAPSLPNLRTSLPPPPSEPVSRGRRLGARTPH